MSLVITPVHGSLKIRLNSTLAYTLPQLPELKLGLGGRWQSEVENAAGSVKQDAYLLG